jgi:hypothetical protein
VQLIRRVTTGASPLLYARRRRAISSRHNSALHPTARLRLAGGKRKGRYADSVSH